MKILLVNKHWYLRGGSERAALETKELLERAGHTVEIFGMEDAKNIFQNAWFAPHVDYHNLSVRQTLRAAWRTIYNAPARDRFEALVKNFQPDVVHFHNICHHLSFSLLDVVKKYRIPSVMTMHDYKMLSPNYSLYHDGSICERSLGGKYYRTFLHNCMSKRGWSFIAMIEAYVRTWRRYHNVVDAYIAPSEFLRELWGKVGWNKDRVTVIPYPVNTDVFSFASTDAGYVTFIGRMVPEKGINVFLDAAKLTPAIPYRMIGDGPEKTRIEKRLREEKIANVTLLPWAIGDDLRRLVAEARIVVVPSLWYETSSLVGLEAMSMGKIVLTSDIGALREVAPPELRFPSGNARALADRIVAWYDTPPAERSRLGQALRAEVLAKHAPEQYLKAVLNIYSMVINKKSVGL